MNAEGAPGEKRELTSGLPAYPFKISYGASDDRLNSFYIPALSRSIRFDRTTGFFSSAALAIAAPGIVRLIANGGRMRLLCGAQLSEDDVHAIQKGAELRGVVERVMVGCLSDPTDTSILARLEALAWMIAHGTLEIRVVLPRGTNGLPLPASISREYYHPKEGLFEDSAGNKLAFSGSCNDSMNGWQWNYEVFSVYTTWQRGSGPDTVPALTPYVGGVERRFTSLWDGREPDWIALDVPAAVRERLLTFCPKQAPTTDPLERPGPVELLLPVKSVLPPQTDTTQRERLLFKFLREAPFLENAASIGIETSTVRPWPHQERVVREVVSRFPENFLFCDEVGLGKTVEAGLALRQLVISGRVRRALLLVPKSVLRQWQEEIHEKFILNVPRYDGGQILDVFEREVSSDGRSPWETPLLLASSQLAKRTERQQEILAATPWDLVIVDEAHHARRKDFLTDRYRPNRLMELLAGVGNRQGLRSRTRCLYLLTATPMQVDPVEVWDLLKVLGLGGRWGAIQENFIGFYKELRKPWQDRDWDLLIALLDDYLRSGGTLDPAFVEKASTELGLVTWTTLKGLPTSSKRRQTALQLGTKARAYLEEMLRRHTPLRNRMWRNTRALLREYHKKGLLKDNVPRREPRNVWIELQGGVDGEQDLYHRIEDYITGFYQKYEAERKGLGFVMTVYRRRLTSSFAALRRSLEKRRDFLKGLTHGDLGLTDDDLEQDELDRDVLEEIHAAPPAAAKGELKFVEDFLFRLKNLGTDSKFARLSSDLLRLFKRFNTILLFTQYTDTMDSLRDRLRLVYGRQVACYSGRGGEVWDGAGWVPMPKEELKDAFRRGEDIKILLCTESASEGLNLQTCGVLINYDMPWNPMRVEQRIGRIDRIGQTHPSVLILNYFIEDTVEAVVYKRLEDRIDWFEDVVGELQPILNKVGKTIEQLTMAPGKDRVQKIEEALAELRKELDEKSANALDLSSMADDLAPLPESPPPPLTLQQLERVMVNSRVLGPRFRTDPRLPGAYLLNWEQADQRVTFDPDLFDRHPYTLHLLSYGSPLLEALLESTGEPSGTDGPPGGVVLLRAETPDRVAMFVEREAGRLREARTLSKFESAVERPEPGWREEDVEAASAMFRERCEKEARRLRLLAEGDRVARKLALAEEARVLLLECAYAKIAQAQADDLFETSDTYRFGPEAITKLVEIGLPFKGLKKIAGAIGTPHGADSLYQAFQGRPLRALQQKFDALRKRGIEVLQEYKALGTTIQAANDSVDASSLNKTVWLRLDGAAASAKHKALQVGSSNQTGGAACTAGARAANLDDREASGTRARFRELPSAEVRPFKNAIPLFELKAAAGLFSPDRWEEENVEERLIRDPASCRWVALEGRTQPGPGLFVAQVLGESMNRRIPDGAFCVFKVNPGGSRNGRVVLAQLRSATDPETGGRFTVKVYESEKEQLPDGEWRHKWILLKPDSTDRSFEPILLEMPDGEDIHVIAELVEVLE